MKSSLVLFLVVFAIGSVRGNGQCSVVNYPQLNAMESNCDLSNYMDATELENLPVTGSRKMTLSFSYFYRDDCAQGTTTPEKPIFALTVVRDSTEVNLIELVQTNGLAKVYTTDTSNIRTQITSYQFLADEQTQRVAFSIDLEKGLFDEQDMSSVYYSSASKDSLKYGKFVIDASIQLRFSSNFGFDDFIVEYDRYLPSAILFQHILEVTPPSFQAVFDMKEGTGYSTVNSLSAGTMYFGQNTAIKESKDSSTNPRWAEDGVGIEFTETSQYMSLKPFQMNFLEMYGDNLGLLSSAGFSFWFKLEEIPSVAQSLLRIQTLTDLDSYSLIIDDEGKLVVQLFGTEIGLSKDSLPVGNWTLVTVQFIASETLSNSYLAKATIYFGASLQTSDKDMPEVPAPTGTGQPDSQLIVGGFLGTIYDIKLLSPGPARVNYPSCLADCIIDVGITPICLAKQCPDGTTSCLTSFEEPSKPTKPTPEIPTIILDEAGGISGGAIAGIVIGCLAALAALTIGIHFLRKGMTRQSNKKVAPDLDIEAVTHKNGAQRQEV